MFVEVSPETEEGNSMNITMKRLGLKAGLVLCLFVVLLAQGCCVFGGGDRGGGGHHDNGEKHER